MKRPNSTTVCIIVLAGLFAALLWRILWPPQPPRWADHIAFGGKFFYNISDGYVEVTGALAGQGIGYPDNATTISCYKERRECLVVGVEQIGPSQIGRLDSPTSYPIVKWNDYEIIATNGDDNPNECRKVTISLDRKGETALWVQEPINQANIFCKNVDTKVYKWTIDDPPFWKELNAARDAQH
jgi:hypothetical protein